MNQTIRRIVIGLFFLIPGLIHAAKPVFLITPIDTPPTTIYAGQSVAVSYKIVNNTPFLLRSNGLSYPPSGLTQEAGGCSNPFDLNAGQSCTLNLLITADKLKGNLIGGPVICNTKANPIYCSRPSRGNELNVINNPNPPPVTQTVITANPTSISLLNDGISTQIVTITNQGPLDAYDVGVTTAPGLGVTVSGSCPSPLAAVVPNNTCQLTFQSGTAAGSTSATISGSNTENPIVVPITTGANPNISITNPTQNGSFYVDLDTPAALQITIANASGTLPTKISATAPTGWTDASVDVSLCQDLQPGTDCVLTLNSLSPYIPATLTINGTNGANTLTKVVATFMGGGLVFYTDSNQVKVAKAANTDTDQLWQNGTVIVGADDVNDGATNTITIVGNGSIVSPVAKLCSNLSAIPTVPNDTGWYLPAICELGGGGHAPDFPTGCSISNASYNVYLLRAFDPQSFNTTSANGYWSSTETTSSNPGTYAWLQTIASVNQQIKAEESFPAAIRCTRAFTY